MNVKFCPACRSLILVDFRYCPYCGAEAKKGPDLEEALEAPFAEIERRQAEQGRASTDPDPFSAVRELLDRLEADMDVILEELSREERQA